MKKKNSFFFYSIDRSMEIGIGGLQPSFARVTEASQDEQGFYGKAYILKREKGKGVT